MSNDDKNSLHITDNLVITASQDNKTFFDTEEDVLIHIHYLINSRNDKWDGGLFMPFVEPFTFIKNDVEHTVSIQCSKTAYSLPRKNQNAMYTHAEIGFPSFSFDETFIKRYAEDVESPHFTVYPFVPLEEIAHQIFKFISKA